jgi:WD40 repeat protein
MISAGADSLAYLWEVSSGKLVRTFRHPAAVLSARFDQSGEYILTVDEEGTVRLLEISSANVLVIVRHEEHNVKAVGFTRSGSEFFIVNDSGTIQTLSITSHKRNTVHVFDPKKCHYYDSTIDGEHIMTVCGGEVRVWHRYETAVSFEASFRNSDRVARLSPDGQYVLTAGKKRSAHLWNTRSGRLFKFINSSMEDAWLSPDGKRILIRDVSGTVKLWDAVSGGQFLIVGIHDDDSITSATFSQDGSRFFTVQDAAYDGVVLVRLWDTVSGIELFSFREPSGSLTAISFTHDARGVLTAGGDGIIRLWKCELCDPIDDVLNRRSR